MIQLTKPELAMVDLFAGCGGLSLGMENAGFTPVFVNELNPDAMATYLTNRRHSILGLPFAEQEALRCSDAQELHGERLEQLVESLEEIGLSIPTLKDAKSAVGNGTLDLLAGGPPCQGYSGLGYRRSYSVDKRDIPSNQLYQRMAKIIARLRPKIFLFENVRGLLNSKWTRDSERKIWPDVLSEFGTISGYSVRWSLVKASDYGVPQNRPRVLLVGIRNDIAATSPLIDLTCQTEDAVKAGFLPKPNPQDCPDLVDLMGDLIDPNIIGRLARREFPKGKFETSTYPLKASTSIQKRMRARPSGIDGGGKNKLTDHEYSKHSERILSKFRHMLENGGEIPADARTKKFSQRVLKARWGNSSPNITATSMPDDYVHFSQPRTLTVREWARLQLFPDWYQFMGKRTTGGLRRAGNPREGNFDREVPKYTQIGNAVPVELAERVGDHFRLILRKQST